MNNPPQPQRMGRPRRSTTTLPKLRSKRSFLLIVLASVVSLLVAIFTNQGALTWPTAVWFIVSINAILLIIFEVIFRALNLYEEYQHENTRYENNCLTLIKDVFHIPPVIIILGVVAIAVIIATMTKNPIVLWYEMGPWSQLASLFFGFFLERALNLRRGPLYDSLWIENSNGLDYGSAMALSFFFGYLNLIIPKSSASTEKNFQELVKDYEDRHQVKLEFHKLFILIPKSLYCSTSLKNENNPSIEESSSLDEIVLTVAGVRNRVYKNSVYKIKNGDRFQYVCAEYATPLKTFSHGINYNGEYSRYYQKHKNDIVLKFYYTLKKVLQEHPACTNFCELVFYDDKDGNGRNKDVGHILMQRIVKLRSKMP